MVLGGELGSFLSAVYTEIRGGISYVQEQRMEYVVIGAELLIEIYNKFEEEKQPQPESLKEIFYWYASDYCDVFAAEPHQRPDRSGKRMLHCEYDHE